MNTTGAIRADAAEDEHEKRAREVEEAIRKADKRKRDDQNVDLATERGSGGDSGKELDKLLSGLHTKLADCVTKLDVMSSRLDAMEEKTRKDDKARHKDDGDGDLEETEEKRKLREEGEAEREERREMGGARQVVADSDVTRRHKLADAQARADACAATWGQRADPPLSGEGLRAYRCRQLRRYQKWSPQYKAADLDSITDEAVFGPIEAQIYADAIAAASLPDSVPDGTLRPVSRRLPGGHTEITFVGKPHAWMSQFAQGRSRFVTKINPKPNEM